MSCEPKFTFQLELTTHCNLKCSFCPRLEIIKKNIRPLKHIDFDFFRFVVNRLKEYNKPSLVSISGLGEPLLYPKFVKAISLINSELGGLDKLRINTNATLLNDDTNKFLIESDIDYLIIGLNLVNKELYKKYTGSLNYEEVVMKIIRFLELKGNRKPDTSLRVLSFDPNIPFIGETKKFWTGCLNENDEFKLTHYSNWAGKIELESSSFSKINKCSYLGRYMAIDLEGNAYPCCYGPSETPESFLYLGNIKDKKIESLYNSNRMNELKHFHQLKKYPFPCNVCSNIINYF